jgi:cyclase
MHRSLIVARLKSEDHDAVAKIFAESDSTELPELVGVNRRTLFSFHGLYFHLVEADENIGPRLYAAREHPLFTDVNTKLAQYMRPYSPDWKEPKDSMAQVFYSWSKDGK